MSKELHRIFEQRFGRAPRIFQAPGRVNLIGEHTDYNEGFVLPVAIDRSTLVAIAPRADRIVRVVSAAKGGDEACFDLNAPAARRDWSDYVQGVAVSLMEVGVPVKGADLYITGELPMGSGLSSSAALEVSAALAFLSLSDSTVDRRRLAQICRRAENQFVGVPCGIMDQFVGCLAERDHALLIDCRLLEFEPIPMPADAMDIVVCNTTVLHELASSAYRQRREECAEGIRRLREIRPDLPALRDLTKEECEFLIHLLPDTIYRRCRHVISENARVLQGARALRAGDLNTFGELMYASHESLSEDYEVSCRELDFLVEHARLIPGVYGARMTGGGFGGCTVQLVHRPAVAAFVETICGLYQQQFGIDPPVYIFHAASAAGECH